MSVKVGVLALQGDFREHFEVLKGLGADPVLIKFPEDLVEVKALVLPGGESTTQRGLMQALNFFDAIKEFAQRENPILGTCAGVILLASEVLGEPPGFSMGLLDVKVARNAYGRQRESFEAPLEVTLDNGRIETQGIFIRAPKILSVGKNVKVLAKWRDDIVLVQQGKIIGATFHPELSGDPSIHSYFLKLAER
jgi:5'-phosphate synthase pdxT subunit